MRNCIYNLEQNLVILQVIAELKWLESRILLLSLTMSDNPEKFGLSDSTGDSPLTIPGEHSLSVINDSHCSKCLVPWLAQHQVSTISMTLV